MKYVMQAVLVIALLALLIYVLAYTGVRLLRVSGG